MGWITKSVSPTDESHTTTIGEREKMDTQQKVTADILAGAYVKMREARAKLASEFEQADNELKEQMEVVKSNLLDICKTVGADSIKTKHGTVMRVVREKFWTNNWDEFYKTMLEHKAPELLEKRIAQGNMKQFMEEHPDVHPPGLNVDRVYDVSVRKAK